VNKSRGTLLHAFSCALLALLWTVSSPERALAFYIDPGTGSFIIQTLLAGLFAAAFFIKQIRTRIISAVRVLRDKLTKKRHDSTVP